MELMVEDPYHIHHEVAPYKTQPILYEFHLLQIKHQYVFVD